MSKKNLKHINSLLIRNPSLTKEWHPTKNGILTPADVTYGSERKAWWICSKGHEWQAAINHRTKGRACPYCSGQAVNETNSLETMNPKLASEWHPSRNGILTPQGITLGSGKKVWWLCNKGHEWQATMYHRTKGRGCPYCNSQTSQLELRIYTEIKYLFKDVNHRKKIYGVECDIYIPEIDVAIEVDGLHWHKNKYDKDKEKSYLLLRNGVVLIRVREVNLKQVSENDIFFTRKDNEVSILRRILDKILEARTVRKDIKSKIEEYLKDGLIINNREYLELLAMLPSPLPGRSLEDCNKALSNEWHPIRNASLSPKDVSVSTNKKVWWICNKDHEWQATVNHRSNGQGCPYCSGNLLRKENCLQIVNSKLAKEWHPTKNGSLTPRNVSVFSNKKAWWVCSKGHEWKATINSRSSGTGCPYCSGNLVCKEDCLKTKNKKLAKEWHPTRNGTLTPQDVLPGSGRKVWWICGKGHEWQSVISSRNSGVGCPYCLGRTVSDENCLQTVNPQLAKGWHPAKNIPLTARDVTPGSNKKVWWLCNKGHEWEATVNHRTSNRGCPFCIGKRASKENNLSVVNPRLAKEWHPINNIPLTPRDVTPGSSKKVWWLCSKGHEWQAVINSRHSGVGCAFCSGRTVSKENCLQIVNPTLAREWHPNKNGGLTAKDVTPGSGKKIWWLCSKGHEWQAGVYSRNSGSGCPYCSNRAYLITNNQRSNNGKF